jgi:hypothetical protein
MDDELDKLETATRDHSIGLEESTAAISTLRGNIWYWLAQKDEILKEDYLARSRARFEQAQDVHPSLWSAFGLLEAERQLSGSVNIAGYAEVAQTALDRLGNRREPRSMVLLSETRFIALCLVGESNPESADLSTARTDLINRLSGVDDALTIYSQVEKHNIPFAQYRAEVDGLFKQYMN